MEVEFEDGLKGKVRFEPSRLVGMFAKLKDHDYFCKVGIAHGAVSWPNEEPDMCPETMHDEIIRNDGEWVLS